jgi:FAD/FMN-containing dehydrogenase
VAVPEDLDDVVTLLAWAVETGTPLTPRASGSGMPGGNVGAGVVVDVTRAFQGDLVVDPGRGVVRAGAARTCREVGGAAAAYGKFLPPEPSSAAYCTVGGMASTNAAGARSHKYGATRSWVEALEFVTTDGQTGRADRCRPEADPRTAAERRLIADVVPYLVQHRRPLESSGPRTGKNSSGYLLANQPDQGWVRHLLIGSEGTLAFITAVEFRLAPLPDDRSCLLVALASLGDVVRCLEELQRFEPAAVELLDRTYLDFVRAAAQGPVPAGTEAVLLVELESAAPGVQAALRGIATSVTHATEPETMSRLWEIRHLASPILAGLPDVMRSLQVVEDGCVPLASLGDYITGMRRIVRAHGFEVVMFGHAGDGHVHANLLADVTRPDLAARLTDCLLEVTALQIELGGTTAGEHGDGRLRSPFLARLYGAEYVEACRRVKRAFDPSGILNPGVKLNVEPALQASALKVGRGARPIPPDAAQALRQVEREARWGAFKLDLLSPPEPSL